MRILLLVAVLSVFMTGCKEDFDIAAERKDIPVVYGLLSRQDTAHYIKVERAFLDPKRSAFDLAQIPDSFYYQNLDVKIEDLNDGKFYTMREVDGTNEGYPRKPGPFAQFPNIMYKLTAAELPLRPEGTYKLHINRGDGSPVVTATTTLVEDFNITTPSPTARMQIVNTSQTLVRWLPSDNAAFYDVYVTTHFTEAPFNNPNDTILKSIRWKVADRVTANQVSFLGENYLRFLRDNLEKNEAINRELIGVDVTVVAGGPEFFDYVNVIIANSGITSSEEVPNYSNISEGLGIFSSRARAYSPNHDLTPQSLDTLKNGAITRDLNFQ